MKGQSQDTASPQTEPHTQDGTEWRDGVPISTRFDDPYYSLDNGPAETAHVFLNGNQLSERISAPLRIGELGFGTGLNLVMTYHLWRQQGGAPLHFTSFEAFPLDAEEMAAALAAFPALRTESDALLAAIRTGAGELEAGFSFDIIRGDARTTLPQWGGLVDAWFLDGFSPAKNPELWGADLMQAVFDHTAPSGTFATYTAAGHVRRSLEAAGFTLERVPGFGRKRHMTVGHRPT